MTTTNKTIGTLARECADEAWGVLLQGAAVSRVDDDVVSDDGTNVRPVAAWDPMMGDWEALDEQIGHKADRDERAAFESAYKARLNMRIVEVGDAADDAADNGDAFESVASPDDFNSCDELTPDDGPHEPDSELATDVVRYTSPNKPAITVAVYRQYGRAAIRWNDGWDWTDLYKSGETTREILARYLAGDMRE